MFNKIKYFFCPNCHITSIREHPKHNGLVKCTFCAYTADKDKHMKDVDERIKNDL